MLQGVLAIFFLAFLAPWVQRLTRSYAAWVLSLPPLVLTLYLASLWPQIQGGNSLQVSYPWVPFLGVELSFLLDGLSLLFALLITGIGTLIVVYAGAYLKGHAQLGRFYLYLLLFMGSMLGLVLSDGLMALFVFWELTSVSSYLLIGFHHEEEDSRSAALQALLVTGLGGLALLAGLVLLGEVGGTYQFHELLARRDLIQSHPYYLGILLMVLGGAFTKSAQFPFHFWLPRAMAAPTPVSAYLHSATMVKAGIYLLARLHPALGGSEAWIYGLGLTGGATVLVASYLALKSTDLKQLLAYSTVSSLGILTLLLGIGNSLAIQGAMAFLLGHALYKGALFMVAGTVDHETGTREVTRLGGLAKAMPVTAVAAALSALSMAGLPPLFGFVAKELVYEGVQAATWQAPLFTGCLLLGSAVLVAVAAMVAVEPFFGKKVKTPKSPHEGPASLWLGPVILGLLSLALGIFPHPGAGGMMQSSVQAVLGRAEPFHLALWHGMGKTLALSGAALASGSVLYLLRARLRHLLAKLKRLGHWGPARWYEGALWLLKTVAAWQTRILQSGYLRYYLIMVLAASVALPAYALFSRFPVTLPRLGGDLLSYEVILMALIVLAALMVALSRSRLGAVAALGVVGYGVALVFILYGAPDLAMAQILIETLVVILLVLGFHHMPGFFFLSSRKALLRDAFIALAVGATMTVLVLAATQIRFIPTVWEYYAQNSLVAAHGRNIVNVILVDFRALDTFGEILVLALAGLGVLAMLKLRPSEKEKK